jgi:hypothetical protein
MRPLVLDGGDDARLAIGPVDGLDAGYVPEFRFRPVAGDEKAGLDRLACRKPRSGAARVRGEALDGGGEAQFHAECRRRIEQRADHRRIRHHMRERLARSRLALECQEDGPDRIGGSRVGNDHPVDRLRFGQHLLPQAEGGQHARRARGDG